MATLHFVAGLVLAAGLAVRAAHPSFAFSQEQIDSGAALVDLNQQAMDATLVRIADGKMPGCSKDNLMVRREWRHTPPEERIAFTSAVKCLMHLPSNYPDVEAAKSQYEDFIIHHYRITPKHHMSATFLTFHRYYLWTYENKLRTLCNYTGTLPYWEWGFDTEDLHLSPVFDGSATSMGSDGARTDHAGIEIGSEKIILPAGTGGGCVARGPFADMVVHAGPMLLPIYGGNDVASAPDPMRDNPRCLKRDLNAFSGAKWASLRNTTELILNAKTIQEFQETAQGDPRSVTGVSRGMGVHGGGHYMIGGDPGGDVYLSPGDPVFYLHHSQLDRLYWIWQSLDWENRQNIFGTGTWLNNPPTPVVKIDEYIDLRPLNEPLQIFKLMDTVGATPFCYIYRSD